MEQGSIRFTVKLISVVTESTDPLSEKTYEPIWVRFVAPLIQMFPPVEVTLSKIIDQVELIDLVEVGVVKKLTVCPQAGL